MKILENKEEKSRALKERSGIKREIEEKIQRRIINELWEGLKNPICYR
jgi:hypothetical protein